MRRRFGEAFEDIGQHHARAFAPSYIKTASARLLVIETGRDGGPVTLKGYRHL
jgi:hypothetical protein